MYKIQRFLINSKNGIKRHNAETMRFADLKKWATKNKQEITNGIIVKII